MQKGDYTMLCIDIVPDESHEYPYATAWTGFSINTLACSIIFAHPGHPNFKFRDPSVGFLYQGNERIDGNNSVNHLKVHSDLPLINVDYGLHSYYPIPERTAQAPIIFCNGSSRNFVVPVGVDCILAAFPNEVHWGEPDFWHSAASAEYLAIIWNHNSLTHPQYKFCYCGWRRDAVGNHKFDWELYYNTNENVICAATQPGDSSPTAPAIEKHSRLRWIKGEWIQEVDGYDTRFLDEWISLGIDPDTGRFLDEVPFTPQLSAKSTKARLKKLQEPFRNSSLYSVSESSSGFYQALYSAVNGIQTYNIMSLLFIKDTVEMIRGLASLKKNPAKSFSKLKRTSFWKNTANFHLSVKYGLMTEVSDIKHIVDKTFLEKPEKKKSYGTCFDQSPIYGPAITDIHTRYQVNIRYRDKDSHFESLVSRARKLGLMPDLSLVWEAIPFSFVADWVTNIGGLVTTLDSTQYGIFDRTGSVGRWEEFASTQLAVRPTSITFSYKSQGYIDSEFGKLSFTHYHRVPMVSMPYLPMVYDLKLHSGYVNHVSELVSLLLQRLPR